MIKLEAWQSLADCTDPEIIGDIVNFYKTHHYSSTTWNFFIEKGTEVIEGKRTLSSFRKLKIPEPSELQVNYHDNYHI